MKVLEYLKTHKHDTSLNIPLPKEKMFKLTFKESENNADNTQQNKEIKS